MMLQEDVKALLNSGRPLPQLLADLHAHPMQVPSKAGLLPFARESLGVAPDSEDDWYRKAWWGYYASMVVRKHLRKGRADEVLELVEPIDWRPLDSALESGNGAILATAHMGLSRVSVACAEQSEYPVVRIHAGSSADTQQHGAILAVTTPQERKTSLIRSMSHLRRGGILICAPDGRYGDNYFLTRFLNQEIRIYYGLGELAKLARAPTLWFKAGWTNNDRIRVSLEPLEPLCEAGSDDWTRHWYSAYLDKLALQMRENPADLGLRKGLWWTEKWGVHWYQKVEESEHATTTRPASRSGGKSFRLLRRAVRTLTRRNG
jgi:hypothetical protein